MLEIYILGLKDGNYPVEISSQVKKIDGIFPEFFGEISFTGKLIKLGNRLDILGVAKCKAKLECDISLEEYEEEITSNINITAMYKTENIDVKEYEDVIFLKEEDKFLDISLPVAESISLDLPMKRVAPKYRDKDFKEIYPEFAAETNSDSINKWDVLKNIKLN